ncbi:MAG TPA: bifunctional precorrin-2 dehydrogenase/sirohydrochlorin ferrochelatase [Candidatus Choladousia intestinavium]|uniref:precorrin-2 dehydrogenase n=1 Tax=Candidatus Choladousia intestinavium TaxID=2840727 RepID=A0A9D1AG25_9FIRM|nr:bifunctional precorrin-2 dehydrogenase/sirohydrochlorin ferrochelatase [Candidatus Choladousia intestinavium]
MNAAADAAQEEEEMSSEKKLYFPMFVDLTDKKVVVVGAGTIAKRRIRTMADFTNHLVVIAPEVNPELKELEEAGKLTILKKTYQQEDICDASMVIAATSDNKVNQEIYAVCKCLGIPVNVYKDKTKCDFFFPGVATYEHTVVGVSSSGREQRKSRGIAEKIQNFLKEEMEGKEEQ